MGFKLQENVTHRQAFGAAEAYLEAQGIRDASPDVSLLMEGAAGLYGNAYYMHQSDVMSSDARLRFEKDVEARGRRIPVQQILQEAWFYGRRFRVDSSVLIPRMDTEILIEQALPFLDAGSRVLDLCTGSGCIILTLVLEAGVKGFGSDVSAEALRTAARNGKQLQAGCTWIESDLFENIGGIYDMIVSNPPYIPTGQIPLLDPEVREHEPVNALDGGPDGLFFYRKIAEEAGCYLSAGGRLFLEIGYDQGESVPKLLAENGWKEIKVARDLAGHPRVVRAVRP